MERFLYAVRNWRAHWRAFYLGSYVVVEGVFAKLLGDVDRIRLYGSLSAVVLRGDGRRVDLGCIGRRVVTTAGVNYLRDDFAGGASDINLFKFHDSGIGTTAEAVGDTALVTPTGDARVAGTQDGTVAKTYKTVATIAYAADKAVTEHGIFSAAAAGTLWDRTKFAAINVVGGADSIQFTYTLTISDGG